jgi:uncharacterized membrane protein YfcA
MNEYLLIFSAGVVAAAGFVRGYGGFGFSMITVAALSLVLPPMRIVPMVVLLEVAASLFLLPGIWQAVNWPILIWLLMGVAAGTPMGVWLLGTVPAAPMKMAVAAVIMILAGLLKKGFVRRRRSGTPETVAVGLASGLFNGAAAIGGPPAILFFFSSPAGAAVSRASLIAFFLLTDTLAAGACALAGLVTGDHVRGALIMVLPMFAGLFAGKRAFMRTSEKTFRRRVLLCLIGLSMLTMIRAALEMANR